MRTEDIVAYSIFFLALGFLGAFALGAFFLPKRKSARCKESTPLKIRPQLYERIVKEEVSITYTFKTKRSPIIITVPRRHQFDVGIVNGFLTVKKADGFLRIPVSEIKEIKHIEKPVTTYVEFKP